MKNIDLETFHKKITKKITIFSGNADNVKRMSRIIHSFRLKPYSVFCNDFSFTDGIDKHWVDEYNNSLLLTDTGLNIIYNDTNIKTKQITTDLFYGRSIRRTAEESQIALFLTGRISSAIILYGRDEYYRAYLYNQDKWVKISPLLFGLEFATILADVSGIGTVRDFSPKGLNMHNSLNFERCILTPWPNKLDISSNLNNQIRKAIGYNR